MTDNGFSIDAERAAFDEWRREHEAQAMADPTVPYWWDLADRDKEAERTGQPRLIPQNNRLIAAYLDRFLSRRRPRTAEETAAHLQATLNKQFARRATEDRFDRLAANPKFVAWVEESFAAYEASLAEQKKVKAVA
jgi:hypothetical protein